MTSSIYKLTFAALLVWVLSLASGNAQSLFADKEQMDELARQMQTIGTEITAEMDNTQNSIDKLLGAGASDSADAVRQYFDLLETQARKILSLVSVNSNFMDALDSADRRLDVMQKRFAANLKASDGEDADAKLNLERIQRLRQNFSEQMNELRETEKNIIAAILLNANTRDRLLLEGQIKDAEQVATDLGKVSDKLRSAAEKLQEISTAALASEDASNISTE